MGNGHFTSVQTGRNADLSSPAEPVSLGATSARYPATALARPSATTPPNRVGVKTTSCCLSWARPSVRSPPETREHAQFEALPDRHSPRARRPLRNAAVPWRDRQAFLLPHRRQA